MSATGESCLGRKPVASNLASNGVVSRDPVESDLAPNGVVSRDPVESDLAPNGGVESREPVESDLAPNGVESREPNGVESREPNAVCPTNPVSASPVSKSSPYGPNGHGPAKSGPAPNSSVPYRQNAAVTTNSVSAGLKTVFVYIPFNVVGFIIGHHGKNIRRIAKSSGASLILCAEIKDFPETLKDIISAIYGFTQEWRKLKITGSYLAIKNAQSMIFSQLNKTFCVTDSSINGNYQLIVEIMVLTNKIGQIIGRGGWKVSRLELTTGCKIRVPHSNARTNSVNSTSSVFIVGDFKSTQLAQKKIHWLLQESKR